MAWYSYKYVTESVFSPGIVRHAFKLRALPCDNEFQRVEMTTFEVSPGCALCSSTDGQGNAVQWGAYDCLHDTFRVVSAGRVEQTQPYALHGTPQPYYLTPTHLTAYNAGMQQRARLAAQDATGPFDTARRLMQLVHEWLTYTPGLTTTATTAQEVFADRRGVCQDYAHLMIALCRSLGLHARYANGLIEGEGQTHAWVEVSDGEVWLPFDPTHDVEPQWGYIKIAHGRDANDCATIRGRFYSWTSECQTAVCQLVTQ